MFLALCGVLWLHPNVGAGGYNNKRAKGHSGLLSLSLSDDNRGHQASHDRVKARSLFPTGWLEEQDRRSKKQANSKGRARRARISAEIPGLYFGVADFPNTSRATL
ncbi:hypothetical protein BJ875DRAFT_464457 [Amylocarpus encephaloides]|uniref:Secreted protein n=1 Tax=Amylocarpus encephaloides TaxID=45428 RepID=A0A9P8C4L5_9HELO|nr:hypothetical protein BJ875DRAFT_464457 [Amylocarpus encephaloides]